MTTNRASALDRVHNAVAAPDRVGQATVVEQSRAVAEVMAAVQVAQACPRNPHAARDEMLQSCRIKALADRAFYAVPNRGSGPTVHLARELARIWGNVQYGVHELSRDDDAGVSEIQAYAWDVQTNTRSVRTFQVPHARMANRQRQALTDLGDIYNNNQNVGARAVRECIFTILPPWLVEEAKDTCHRTLVEGEGKPLAQRVSDAIRAFDGIGVSVQQLEERTGKPSAKWSENDVAQLGVLFRSIDRGELQVDEEFPKQTLSASDITAQATRRGKAPQQATPPAAEYDPTTEPGWQPEGGAA
jgi:hypothetical protein